jgi:hypothetical protein
MSAPLEGWTAVQILMIAPQYALCNQVDHGRCPTPQGGESAMKVRANAARAVATSEPPQVILCDINDVIAAADAVATERE